MTQEEKMSITYYYKCNSPTGKIRAEFGIRIKKLDLTFSKMKLIDGPHGLFVIGPSKPFTDKEGKEKYSFFWHFGKETDKEFKEEALRTVLAYENSQVSPIAKKKEETEVREGKPNIIEDFPDSTCPF